MIAVLMKYRKSILHSNNAICLVKVSVDNFSCFLYSADVKHFLQKLTSQLMNCCVDEKSKEMKSVKTSKTTNYSMDSLSSWYMTATQVMEMNVQKADSRLF